MNIKPFIWPGEERLSCVVVDIVCSTISVDAFLPSSGQGSAGLSQTDGLAHGVQHGVAPPAVCLPSRTTLLRTVHIHNILALCRSKIFRDYQSTTFVLKLNKLIFLHKIINSFLQKRKTAILLIRLLLCFATKF